MRTVTDEKQVDATGRWVWRAPIAEWSEQDCLDYIDDHELPRNPVVADIHRSGECFCGSFATRDEELIDLAEACPIRRGMFQNMGRRVVQGDQLHLFECSDGMASLSSRTEESGVELPDNLRAAWRVGDAVVRCDAPDLRVEFVPAGAEAAGEDLLSREDLPERIRKWFLKIKRVHEEQLESSDFPPYDNIETIGRHFYIEPLDRTWRTSRMVRHDPDRDCTPDENGVWTYPCPASQVEWDFDEFPTVFRRWKYRLRENL